MADDLNGDAMLLVNCLSTASGGNPIQSRLTNEQPVKDVAAKGQERKQAAGQY
jgi:hypothetical protein